MRNIAKTAPKDREALFRNTAEAKKMTDAIVEKDFWVCYVLDYLFRRSKWKDKIAFKGGTSLRDDYEHMQNMLFGDKPSFEEIISCISKLEEEINAI